MAIFDDLKIPEFNLKSTCGQYKLSISVFSGQLVFAIWRQQGGNGKPVAQRKYNIETYLKVRNMFKNILGCQPETKSMVKSKIWPQGEKQPTLNGFISAGRDEKQIYYIDMMGTFDDGSNNQYNVRFNVMGSGMVFMDEREESPTGRSEARFEAITEFMINNVPMLIAMTRKKQTGGKKNWNNNGGGNGNWNNNNGGGQQQSYQAPQPAPAPAPQPPAQPEQQYVQPAENHPF